MKEELFGELIQSIKEAGAIIREESVPSRKFEYKDPDVTTIRKRLGLSQSKFAGLLGISVKTLQNWEQGRRKPRGPARILLLVAAQHPDSLLDVVSGM